ncbi:MAG: hypothetical protein IJ302_00265, partial [Clostridia bacterium]|nr:hypothetical protein [Clostridia bacterium]
GGNPIESAVDLAGDPEGDIVDTAIYERNRAIEEDLNVTLEFFDAGIKSGETGDTIRTLAMAAEDLYDVYTVCQWNAVMLAAEHVFLNLSDAPYIDYEKPWWSKQYIDACSVGQKHLYFLAGDVSLDMIRCISALYFNKNMLTNLDFDANELYQTVIDGDWTADKLLTYASAAYSDLNASGKADEGDQYGLLLNSSNGMDSISFALGLQLTAHDEEHYPYLVGDREHNHNVFDKLQKLVYETPGISPGEPEQNQQQFIEGNSLFLGGFLYTSERLRDMKDDFGVIPYPKYDETQENFISVLHDITSLMCIPVTCTRFDTTCAVLEAIAYTSYYDVTPVYYDSALKVKYSRDDITPQVIDIIRDSAATDIAYVYIDAFNSLGRIMRGSSFKNYASTYERTAKGAQKMMEKFIASFEEVIE